MMEFALVTGVGALALVLFAAVLWGLGRLLMIATDTRLEPNDPVLIGPMAVGLIGVIALAFGALFCFFVGLFVGNLAGWFQR